MTEYIEREALLKDISESVVFTVRSNIPSLEMRGAQKIIDRIKSVPTADVVKVFKEEIQRLEKEKADLEVELAINKGAMRAYREAFENAHDEAVKDFSHFLIDKAKDGCIEISELPELVVEWSSPSRRHAELMKEVGEAFQKGVQEGGKPSPVLCEGSITGKNFYEERFQKVE